MQFFYLICFVLFWSADSATTDLYTQTQTGNATFYGYTSGGACSLDPLPSWVNNDQNGSPTKPISVAMNAPQYANSTTCGLCANVTGNGIGSGTTPVDGTFLVYVADECPECKTGSLDFGDTGDGRWNINWVAVACPVIGNVQFLCQGCNDYYLKLQARNTPYPIASITVTAPINVLLTRSSDNFFVGSPSSQLTYPITVHVTDIYGSSIDQSLNKTALNGNVTDGSGNIGSSSVSSPSVAASPKSSKTNSRQTPLPSISSSAISFLPSFSKSHSVNSLTPSVGLPQLNTVSPSPKSSKTNSRQTLLPSFSNSRFTILPSFSNSVSK